MASEHQFQMDAHPNLYTGKSRAEQLSIVFAVPEQGITETTGVLLLIHGFGESIEMPHLVEARGRLADVHNMVVVQCDYFGTEFMQESKTVSYQIDTEVLKQVFTLNELQEVYDGNTVSMDNLFHIGRKYDIFIEGMEQLSESEESFNDMGLMQAIDNLSAIHAVLAIIRDNGYKIDYFRIHALGQGHGAYLTYLCNALAPHLFAAIIDNSAWLFPTYLLAPRITGGKYGKLSFRVIFEYLASKLPCDKQFYDLHSLYKNIRNQACIISFHGADDGFTSLRDKRQFCDNVRLCVLHEVTKTEPQSALLSAVHGLGIDLVHLYDYALSISSIMRPVIMESTPSKTVLETKEYHYCVDFSSGMPVVERIAKQV